MVLAVSEHDAGVWDVATMSGRAALLSAHQVLATFAMASAVTHVSALLVLESAPLTAYQLVLPLVGGGEVRHALGVLGLELMLAASITAALQRTVFHRNWVHLHRLAYVGVWLSAMHAWLGAAAGGHVPVVWLAGITVLIPAITVTVLRSLPPPLLVRLGVIAADPPVVRGGPTGVRVAVDHERCRHYALCQAQAPKVFRLLDDGRLRYARNPDADQAPQVRAAARVCPVRAIRVDAVEVGGP